MMQRYLCRLCKWHFLEGAVVMRLHLLPSLVLPTQRTFLATFFFVALFLATFFFLVFRGAMSIPP
jgi:hypothetical protein